MISDHLKAVGLAAVPLLLLVLWRVWSFTIVPTMNPDEPRALPYWLPFIGTFPLRDGD
jgi:hypothetical protein